MAPGAALPEELGTRSAWLSARLRGCVDGTNGAGGDIHQVLLPIYVHNAGRRRLGVNGDYEGAKG
jgi:hypothetical protein